MKKRNLKDLIIGIIIGGIVFSGITATAITLTAEEVKYKPSNDKFTATNVKEAMDEIYKLSEYKIPADTYFYDENTIGEDIVRYKKVDGKYYLCDENGKIINNEEQDVASLVLVEYISTSSSLNIEKGISVFSNNNLILGSLVGGTNYNVEEKKASYTYTCSANSACNFSFSTKVTFSQNVDAVYIKKFNDSHSSYSLITNDIVIQDNVATISGTASIGGGKTMTLSLDVIGIY